jgi:hypothetical protein
VLQIVLENVDGGKLVIGREEVPGANTIVMLLDVLVVT